MDSELAHAGASKYRIIRPLGSGGMGVVYLARDLLLNRDVAIKYVAPGRLADPQARERLLREAQALAALDHPAICPVYEVVAGAGDQACIVMQYVEGETLAARLARGPLELRQALDLALNIASALRAAHERGIVHRDLKPQNIIITASGGPKLLDFGIAKLATAEASEEAAAAVTHTSTATGPFAGTPAYMSPEQVRQKPLDGRSDLFSLGAVLYECLTGRRAFDAPTSVEACGQVLHRHPPAPSSLRPELTIHHDELCSRLLAKEPADRFGSAAEVLGALSLLERGRSPVAPPAAPHPRRFAELLRAAVPWRVAAAVALLGIVAIGVAFWRSTPPLSDPPSEATRWYLRGTEQIREGTYHSARLAFEEAIRVFPRFPQAYARLAETFAELGDEREAQRALLRVTQLVPDQRRLPEEDRVRLDAIRAQVLREYDTAVQAYRALVGRNPGDAGAWLDLARAQEAAGLGADARASLQRALSLDPQSAAAHMRLGTLHALASERSEALGAFDEAERLYRAASNTEGETEVLLRRGGFLDRHGARVEARAVLERALALSTNPERPYQRVRAQLLLSGVTVAEGRFTDAQRLAEEAVAAALAAGLDTVAAAGLVDLGMVFVASRRAEEANAHLTRAIELAHQRGARRTEIRARLQHASLRLTQQRYADARQQADAVLPLVRAVGDRHYELVALSILSRAHEGLREYGPARENALRAYELAGEVNDPSQAAAALENLAGLADLRGDLPEALAFQQKALALYRQQGAEDVLPYILANLAELLIRLGRGDEAERLLSEIDAGAARRIDAYVSRASRVALLRAMRAAIDGRPAAVEPQAVRALSDADASSSTKLLAAALLDYSRSHARSSRTRAVAPDREAAARAPVAYREALYWHLLAAMIRNDAQTVLTESLAALDQLAALPSDEAEWRLALVVAAAAREAGDGGRHAEMSGRAQRALDRLRDRWQQHAERYERRPDLIQLRQLGGATLDDRDVTKGADRD